MILCYTCLHTLIGVNTWFCAINACIFLFTTVNTYNIICNKYTIQVRSRNNIVIMIIILCNVGLLYNLYRTTFWFVYICGIRIKHVSSKPILSMRMMKKQHHLNSQICLEYKFPANRFSFRSGDCLLHQIGDYMNKKQIFLSWLCIHLTQKRSSVYITANCFMVYVTNPHVDNYN